MNHSDWVGLELAGGRYRVLAQLGEGGMGFVYKAMDQNLDTEVVIKVPRREMLESAEFVQRFTQEVRSLVKLVHPNIVKITDVGQLDGVPFAVLQFLSGGSLEDRVSIAQGGRQPMNVQAVPSWLNGVASALDVIHAQRYVHRDVKPANILFDGHGNVFLSDFGVAKALGDVEQSQGPKPRNLTGAGMVLGTPDYMAPELIMGQPFDGRVDQYALAITVFEVLSGRMPFQAPMPTAVLVMHTQQPAPLLHQWVGHVPPAVSQVVFQAMSKAPQQRFPSCSHFAQAFAGAIQSSGSMSAPPLQTPPSSHPPVMTARIVATPPVQAAPSGPLMPPPNPQRTMMEATPVGTPANMPLAKPLPMPVAKPIDSPSQQPTASRSASPTPVAAAVPLDSAGSSPELSPPPASSKAGTYIVLATAVVGGMILLGGAMTLLGGKSKQEDVASALSATGQVSLDRTPTGMDRLVFSADRKQAAGVGNDHSLRIWTTKEGQQQHRLAGHLRTVNGLAFNHDGTRLLSGGDDSRLNVWDLTQGRELSHFSHTQPITCVAWSPADNFVVCGSEDGTLKLWNMDGSTTSRTFSKHARAVLCVAVSPQGEWVLSGGEDRQLKLWNTSDGSLAGTLTGHQAPITSVSFSPDGQRALSTDIDGHIHLWNALTRKELQRWNASKLKATNAWADWCATGQRLFIVQGEKALLCDAKTGDKLAEHTLKCAPLLAAAVSTSGDQAWTADETGQLFGFKFSAPTADERAAWTKIQQSQAEYQTRLTQYQEAMKSGRGLVKIRRFNDAVAQFRIAESLSGGKRDTLESKLAAEALTATQAEATKWTEYQRLLATGQVALKDQKYAAAITAFDEAKQLYPQEDDWKNPLAVAQTKMGEQSKLDQFKSSVMLFAVPSFAFNFEGADPLKSQREFVFLISEGVTPAAVPVTTPLTLNLRLAGPSAAPPPDNVKLVARLLQTSNGQSLWTKEETVLAGRSVQTFNDTVRPPSGGWPLGDLELKAELLLDDEVVTNVSRKLTLGQLTWSTTPVKLQAAQVHAANFEFPTVVNIERGDLLRLDATGTISPSSVVMYRDVLNCVRLSDRLPVPPSGFVPVASADMQKYQLVSPTHPWAALLTKIGSSSWSPASTGQVQQPTQSGPVKLSINSVKQLNNKPLDPGDSPFWQDDGEFQVSLHRGQLKTPSPLSPSAVDQLLAPFSLPQDTSSLSGLWNAGNGTIARIVDDGRLVRFSLVASKDLDFLDVSCTRNGTFMNVDSWKLIFHGDKTQTVRSLKANVTVANPRLINLVTDSISFDRFGRELRTFGSKGTLFKID